MPVNQLLVTDVVSRAGPVGTKHAAEICGLIPFMGSNSSRSETLFLNLIAFVDLLQHSTQNFQDHLQRWTKFQSKQELDLSL